MGALFGGHAAGLLRTIGGYLSQYAIACLLHLLSFAPYAVLESGRLSKGLPFGLSAATHLYDLQLLLPCGCLLHLSLVRLTTASHFHLLLASLLGRFCSRLCWGFYSRRWQLNPGIVGLLHYWVGLGQHRRSLRCCSAELLFHYCSR